MSSLLNRLRSGRRWWAAEVAFRSTGIGLLASCWHFAQLAHRWVLTPPPHQATLAEFGICAVVFALLSTGLALTLEGPGLLRLVPIPKQSVLSRSGAL